MASNINYNDNGFRASKLLVDGGGYLTKQILIQKAISGTIRTIDEFLAEKNVKQTLKKLKSRKIIHAPQYAIIYPANGQPTNLDDWDITLVTLILNNCLTPSPAEYIAIQDIREIRNTLYGHTAKVEMTDNEFQQNWANISSTLIKHSKLLTDPSSTKTIQDLITTILTETLSADKTIETLKNWYEWSIVVEELIDKLAKEQTMRYEAAETKSDDRHRANQEKLLDIETLQKNTPDELIHKLDKYCREQTVDTLELNRKIAQAKNILEEHRRELEKYGFRHNTQMTEALTQKLRKNKIVVLKGVQGSGKTHLAKNVLVNFLSLKLEMSPLIIRMPGEIEKVLDPTGSFVLLVDDMIGTNSFDGIEYKDWCQYIETLLSQVTVGTLFVVITVRTSIYRQCQDVKFAKLFEDSNVLDVGKFMLEPEKETIFENFAKFHSVDVSCTSTKHIVQQKSVGIGFPLLCRMMKGHDVDQLFQSPVHYLKTEMLRIKEEFTVGFVVLFITLVGDGILSKTYLTKNQKSSFQALQTFFSANDLNLNMLYKAAKSLEETYFNFDDTELKFTFIHETIAQSIFVAALEFTPHILIKYCPFDSLIRNLNLIDETPISDSYLKHKQCIMERMIDVMASCGSTSNTKSVASASIWNNNNFVDEAICNFKIIYFYQEVDQGVSMICHFASLGLEFVLKTIISRSKPNEKSEMHEQIIKALEWACLAGKKVCVKYLISKVGELRPDHVFAAVKGGNIEVLKLIITHFGKKNIDTLKQENTGKTIMHIAAEIGRIEIIKYLHKLWPKMLHKKDKNGWNVAHSSAKSGKTECLKYILQNVKIGKHITKVEETLLHVASEGGHIDTINFVLKRYPDMVKMVDLRGRTMAHSAAAAGSIECLKLLIDKGIDPKQKDNDGTTIPQVAAAAGNYTLLKHICKCYEELVLETDSNEYHILHYASMASGLECMQYLSEKYTDVHLKTRQKSVVNLQLNQNKTSKHGNTILHISALRGNISTMTYICEAYPDLLMLTNNDGRNALHHAARTGTVECLKYLVDRGLNPKDKTGDGGIILHRAALGGNIKTMTYICDTYPDLLQSIDNKGKNSLHYAAELGTVECLKYLVDQGLDPRYITEDGYTILHRAALGGSMRTLTYICETYPYLLNLTDNWGRNALHKAAHRGTVECLKYLVNQGLNPRKRTRNKGTILHRAASGGNIIIMTYICDMYPDLLQLTDNDDSNALHYAANQGTDECLIYLVDHELDPTDKTEDGQTILHRAALGGNMNTLSFICETYPGLLQLTDNGGSNALHEAAYGGTVECLKHLVDHGLNPRDNTGFGDTILHQAALGGNIKTLTYICKTYPDMLQLANNTGKNTLHYAAELGSVECLKYLVKQGLNPKARTGKMGNILHRAASGGNINTMTFICETYPDLVHLTDNEGRNALHYAANQGTVECLKYLVAQKLKPTDRTEDGQTILHRAAFGGNINTLTYIRETYPYLLKLTDNCGCNALHKAAQGTITCLKYLVEQGFDPIDKTNETYTILHQAVLSLNMSTITYICKTYPGLIQLTDNTGRNALHLAAENGTVECFKYLVDHKLNPEDKTGYGGTILHRAALGGNMNTMVHICETYPDLIHLANKKGRNALHYAAEQGTVECLKYLVDHKLTPTDRTEDGQTILHRAAFGGNINTLTYICETYSDLIPLTDNNGRNALDNAAGKGTVECFKHLVEHGLNPRDETVDGETILHRAALGGNIKTMTYICETYPALFHLANNAGRNALHNAAGKGTIECLKYLVEHGLKPRDKTVVGETILHRAALGGNMNTMTYICETYPNLQKITDNNGRNALHNSANMGTVECVKYLVDHGLDPLDKTEDGETILQKAALGGNMETLTYICETYPDLLRSTDNGGSNALHKAAAMGTVKCLIFLADQGLNPRDKTEKGETTLHLAALAGNINTMTYICDTYPCLIHLTDNTGRNALHHAAHKGSVECLKYLVEHELNPRDKTGDEKTILHQAALGGNINTLTYICDTYFYLLQSTKKNRKQVLRYAELSGSEECYKYLNNLIINQETNKTCILM